MVDFVRRSQTNIKFNLENYTCFGRNKTNKAALRTSFGFSLLLFRLRCVFVLGNFIGFVFIFVVFMILFVEIQKDEKRVKNAKLEARLCINSYSCEAYGNI